MTKPTSKIIQISSTSCIVGEGPMVEIIALCEDGSLWSGGGGKWIEILDNKYYA